MNRLSLTVFLFDLVVVLATWLAGFGLRFGFVVPPEFQEAAIRQLYWVVPTYASLFLAFRLYRGLWRFASLHDLQQLLLAVGLGSLVVTAISGLFRVPGIPSSVLLMHPALLTIVMGGARFVYRSWKEHRLYGPKRLTGLPVLVVGAGESATGLLRELVRSQDWYAVGVVDNDLVRIGRRIMSVPVYGPIAEIERIAKRLDVSHALIALPPSARRQRREAAERAVAAGLKVMTMPALEEILTDAEIVPSLRPIELEDLLGREPVQLNEQALAEFVGGRVILVSGAGGSIGAEMCRQIARFRPALMVLLELSEFALYRIEQELVDLGYDLPMVCLVGDVKDASRVNEVMQRYRPQVVFHAAAYKHVPLMESENAWEAVRNNVYGTLVLGRAGVDVGVEKFVLISTDKAVNPSSIMGVTKRLAEIICLGLQEEGNTRFITVRFGNVLGSTGSVIPKFKGQIAQGGPVTVTHPDMTRYFMLIPEAAQLVLEAARMGQGGEVFVLDMGEPVKIVDLARDLIRLSGFSERDVRIVFTGLRPGEKLFEELLADSEHSTQTAHPKVRKAAVRESEDNHFVALVTWLEKGQRLSLVELRRTLRQWVPEYLPPQQQFRVVRGTSVAASR